MELPNVTTITTKLDSFPNTKAYLDNLTRDSSVVTNKVHKEYEYSTHIVKNNLYTTYGSFVDYFIRKHISYYKKIDIIDHRAEWVINESDKKPKNIEKCYNVFKNYNLSAMDHIKDIQTVSYCNAIYFEQRFPKYNFGVNKENMLDIVSYINSLSYVHYELNPTVDSDYFNGDADLILDNDVILDIKVSKHKSLHNRRKNISKKSFYQLILYSFGNYKKSNTKVKINKFLIYNPLLGYEYSLSVNEINYEEFECALKLDIQDKVLKISSLSI